ERVSDVAEMANHSPVLVIPEPVAEGAARHFASEFQLTHQPAADVVPLRLRIIDVLTVHLVRFGQPEHVHDPSADRLDHHLCPFAFEEAEHPEVALTLAFLAPKI